MNTARVPCLQKGHPYEKVILRDLNGSAWRGELVVIIGDSTAGKSCFMDLLAGRNVVGTPSGLVEESGRRRDRDWFRKSSLILPQTAFHDWLTVRETVLMAALLKLPSSMAWSMIDANVDKALRITDLAPWRDVYVRNLPDRGVSGGENMRLALAVELVTDPEVLFVDHDLFGMTPDATRRLVHELAKMARVDGRIVFLSVSLHSLPILDLVDKVLVLSRGQALFYGSVRKACRYFTRQGCGTPPDPKLTCFLLDIAAFDLTRRDLRQSCQQRIDRLVAAWKTSRLQYSRPSRPKTLAILGHPGSLQQQAEHSRPTAKGDVRWPHSDWKEFRVLFARESMIRFRNRSKVVLSSVQLIVVALLVGFLYFQLPDNDSGVFSRFSLLFILPKMQYFYFVFPLLNGLFLFRPVVIRERAALAYHPYAQYWASFLSSIPIRLVHSLVFSAIVYYLAGLRTDGFQYFVAFTGILLLNTLASIGFTYLCTGLTRHVEDALIFVPTLIVLSFQFNGGIPQCSWVLRWIQYIFPNYFAVTGLIQNEFSNNPEITGSNAILRASTYDSPSLAWCYGALLIQTAVYAILGYILEERNTRPRFILF
jgi:ATP-binding cassette subfamily G (WHITE) protein 1